MSLWACFNYAILSKQSKALSAGVKVSSPEKVFPFGCEPHDIKRVEEIIKVRRRINLVFSKIIKSDIK